MLPELKKKTKIETNNEMKWIVGSKRARNYAYAKKTVDDSVKYNGGV